MDFEALLDDIRSRKGYAGQIHHLAVLPARPARYADLSVHLHPTVEAILQRLGIRRFYQHQAEAIEAALGGENVVVVSGTASGKTLCYVVPLAQHLYERPTSRALLIYPTKALAQDQLRRLKEFGAGRAFRAATYDGDTPQAQRRSIRRDCQVVLTNPDMLHLGILPYHHTWAEFFRHLDYVVLDEVHTYRGVFGSHTANVLRRLRRVAEKYGARPRFIAGSATIGNPGELFEQLTGLQAHLVDRDGSPQGRRFFVLWNPPLSNKPGTDRRSANIEAAELLGELVRRQVRTIVFVRARLIAELILRYARYRLGEELGQAIMAYRGGYLPAQRREIERRLFTGELLGVVSTTALEVGVDIGGLEAAILVGYPGSIASTWQQIGRAGRALQDSLGVLIALPGGIHGYLLQHPEYLLEQGAERVLIDPHNRYILAAHLACAAFEQPIEDSESALFGDEMLPILEILADPANRDDSDLPYVARSGRWYWVDPQVYPAGEVNLRSCSGQFYEILLRPSGEVVGTVDAASALRTVHPGAIYLHGGDSFEVEELDLEARIAWVRPTRAYHYTKPVVFEQMRVLQWQDRRTLPGAVRCLLGDIEVTTQVTGYQKLQQLTERLLESRELDLPPETFETVGVCVAATEEDVKALAEAGRDLLGSLHALEHAMIAVLPVFAHCDSRDVGGVSTPLHPDLRAPIVCVYDGHPGGVGIAEAAWDRITELLVATAELIEGCPCPDGCPNCVQDPDCGSSNKPLDKWGAALLARRWSAPPTA